MRNSDKNGNFIKISNKDAWEVIMKIKENVELIKDNQQVFIERFLAHEKVDTIRFKDINKTFTNFKWFAGTMLTIIAIGVGVVALF